MNGTARRLGREGRLIATTIPSTIAPISRRPKARAPGDRSSATARMPTKADAHRTTVTSAAPTAVQSVSRVATFIRTQNPRQRPSVANGSG